MLTSRRAEDLAFHRTSKCLHQGAVLNERDHADESCRAICRIAKAAQYKTIVVLVGCIRSGIPGGVDAGFSCERINFQA